MHELSLCKSILETLQREAENHHYKRVKGVRLQIGPFVAVDEQALRFAFEVASEGTLAAGAWLEIDSAPAMAHCTHCAKTVTLGQRFEPCPNCGSHELQLLSGEELRIRDLEVE